MTVSELEEAYQQLHEQLLRGELEEEEFKAEVEQLRFEDDLGGQWRIGWYTGKWYRYDQGQWIQDEPHAQPAPAAPPPPGGGPPVAAGTPPGPEDRSQRRSWTPYLVVALIALLLLASAALIFGWNRDSGGQPDEDTPAVAAITATETAPSAPSNTPGTSPAASATPTHAPLPSSTPTRTPVPSATRRAPTPTPTRTPTQSAETAEATETTLPTSTATVVGTATATLTPRPRPTATLAHTGRIFFPVYDPNPDRRTFDIHAVDLQSGKREILIGQASQPALSPSGKRMAYRSWNSGQRGLLVLELTDGSTWRWISFHEAAHPSWSPDNQNIVFSSQQEADRRWRLYRTWGTDSDKVRRGGGDIFGRVPNWSVDGRLVFWECPVDKCGLHAMNTDGTNLERLTGQEHDTAPATSPDGQQVAFMSNPNGNWEIFITRTHSQGGQGNPEPTRLTRDAARDGLPTWSPDGRWLAFVTDRGGTWSVWVMRPDGTEQQKLFDLGGSLEGEVGRVPPSEQHGWTWESIAWGP